jgi:ADP-ribosylglycohydrolase
VNREERQARARASLEGLALGDAFGEQFFNPANHHHLEARTLPPGPWRWTDDTEMACSVYAELVEHGEIRPDSLITRFAQHHDPARGYSAATSALLEAVRAGGSWRELASAPVGGRGSWGNGAAMRVAPLGAWFADDLEEAAHQAALSAEVTHTHPEGLAGAIAVAVAAAIAASADEPPAPADFLDAVLDHVPAGLVHRGIRTARELPDDTPPEHTAATLGNGSRISAPDTVPFCLWVAAHHLDDDEEALWTTVAADGDLDTTSAILGGIAASRDTGAAVPASWHLSREPLPTDWTDDMRTPTSP